MPSRLIAFLSGQGRDAAGRTLDEILALPDGELESRHDYIQWLFPLMEPSRAVPGSPVLTAEERNLISTDSSIGTNLLRSAARMERFYEANDHWLRGFDHNHLRITRIIRSLRLLVGREEAEDFHQAILARVAAAGRPVNPRSMAFWQEALI